MLFSVIKLYSVLKSEFTKTNLAAVTWPVLKFCPGTSACVWQAKNTWPALEGRQIAFLQRAKSKSWMAFGLSPGRERERSRKESTFLCKYSVFLSLTGSLDVPTAANALLPKGVDRCHFPLNLKSPTPKVIFIFIQSFSSVLELPVMAGAYPLGPRTPFGWHRRLCHWFSLYRPFVHYLQIGAIKCPEKAHGLQAQLPLAGWAPTGSAYVFISAFVILFSLRSSKWMQEVSKMQSSMLADLSFNDNNPDRILEDRAFCLGPASSFLVHV